MFEPRDVGTISPEAMANGGPHNKVQLQLKKEHAGAKAEKPIRMVGVKEEALFEEINTFMKRGMLWKCEGNPQWVARAFLVPKPGGKWRLVIDYRHLDSCLEDKNIFPYPSLRTNWRTSREIFYSPSLIWKMASIRCILRRRARI